ncbi:MAG: PAS domain S-box protein [Deltaproteobacteria bacterium]|nr:PAS domain S-box protein [Deltaproteobacteria bacterium]
MDDYGPEMILSDYSLPQFTGLEALKIKKEHAPGIPLIIVTGSMNEEVAVTCMKAGADDYVLKEQLHRLPKVVAAALEKKRLEKVEIETREALKQAAREWINTFDAVGNPIALLNPEGLVLRCNKAVSDLLSKPFREIIGRPLTSLLGSQSREETAFRIKNSLSRETRLFSFNNRWWSVHIDPILDDSRRLTGFVYIMTDITERHQAEEELARERSKLKKILDLMPDGAVIINSRHEIEYVNPVIEHDFGPPQGRRCYEYLQGLNAPCPWCRNDRVFAGETIRWEWKSQLTGKIYDLFDTPLTNSNGLLSKLEFFHDITALKQTEEALSQSRKRYRSLFEQAPVGIGVAYPDGRIIDANRYLINLLGYSLEELRGMKASQTYEDPLARQAILQQLQQEGRVSDQEVRLKRKDGNILSVLLSMDSIDWESGNVILTSIKDVTEQKNLRSQFQHAQKLEAVGRLAGGIAHDFNNLLSVINGYSELGLDKLEEDHPLRADLQEVRRAGGRAAGLTRQLLAFSRKQALSLEVLNLNEIVGNVEKMLRRLIGEDVELITDLAEDLGPVKGDIGQIEQVLMNLAVNARDAMPGGGKLAIGTRNLSLDQDLALHHPGLAPGLYVLLTVSDTGTGMDRETQGQIFEPFFTTKGQGRGTGLGLSTVYGIVKQIGGDIQVYSEPDLGTTFKIYLPRAGEAGNDRPKIECSGIPSKGNETILVVEDDKALRSLTRHFLESAGYRVLTAADGEQGRRMVEQLREPIHLLLTDVVMPKMNGLELADQLRGLFPELKVLFMSGYADTTIIKPDRIGPGFRFISKPFERVSLFQMVRNLLDQT